MEIFVTTFLILVLLVIAQSSTRSLSSRLSTSVLGLVGFSISVGLVAGWSSFRVTKITIRVLFLTLIFLCVIQSVNNLRKGGLKNSLHKHLSEFFEVLLIPAIFLCAVIVLFAQKNTHHFSFLLNTWDGSSNSGMVAALREFRQVSNFPEFKGVETYPLGTHYLASWLPDLVDTDNVADSLKTVIAFSTLQFLLYILLMILSARLAVIICQQLKLGSAYRVISAWSSQIVFITPFLLENLLFMHSLAFFGALAASLGILLEIIEDETLSTSNFTWVFNMVGFGFLITITSYPLLLPVLGLLLISVVISKRNEFRMNIAFHGPNLLLRLSPFLFCITLGLVQLANIVAVTDPTSRFDLGGHLIAIEPWILLSLTGLTGFVLVALTVYRVRLRTIMLFAFFSVLFIVSFSWLQSSSFDRTYGLNYYAKKSEYVLFTIFLPTGIVGGLLLIKSAIFRFKSFEISKMIFSFLSLLSLFLISREVYDDFYRPLINFEQRNKLMDAALKEGSFDGRSIVWDSSDPNLSRNATLMSNYIDKAGYRTPDSTDFIIIIAQQLQIRNPLNEILEFCGILGWENGRIIDVSTSVVHECSDYL